MDKTYFSMTRVVFFLVFACSVIFNQANAATYNVTVASNSQPWGTDDVGSLEWAIAQCNATAGTHTITFGVTSVTIQNPAKMNLTRSGVTIDGNTAPGYTAGNPTLVITGPGYSFFNWNNVSNVTMRGLVFNAFQLTIDGGSSNTITGCLFDMNAAGNTAVTNNCNYTLLLNNTSAAIIGTSVSPNSFGGGGSGHNVIGITGTSASSNSITYNRIGTNKAGTAVLGAVQYAVYANLSSGGFTASNNTIKGASMGVYCFGGLTTTGVISNNNIASPTSSAINVTASGGSSAVTISGNTITSAGGIGISLSGASSANLGSNTITSSASHGINLVNTNSASITGNTINSSTAGSGIYTSGTTNNLTIQNNNIGASSSGIGAAGLGNKGAGIYITSSVATLSITGNTILDNGLSDQLASSSGIYLYPAAGATLSAVTISGNYIGVDKSGSYSKFGNRFAGVYLEGSLGGTFTGVTISANYIGDNGRPQENLTINRSHGIGILNVNSASVTNVVIKSNYIGIVDAGADRDRGNWADGVSVIQSSGITIGGDAAADGNFIGFNKGDNANTIFEVSAAIILSGTVSNVNIYNNTINTYQATPGSGPYLNGAAAEIANRSKNFGIIVERSSSSIRIGDIGKGNIIAYSKNSGVLVHRSSSTVSIRGNQIFCNTKKGIDLSMGYCYSPNNLNPSGNTPCPGNGSYGATTVSSTNYAEPVITSQSSGAVAGVAPANATIDIYAVSTTCPRACDLTTAPDKQEGALWVGSTTSNGSGAFSATGLTAASGYVVTATSADGRTSEFSTCRILSICPVINLSPNPVTVCYSAGTQTFTVEDDNDLLLTSTVTWTISGGLTHTVTSSNASTQTISVTLASVATATNYTVSVQVTAPTCSPVNASTTLTVHPNPVITGLPASLNLCSPATSNLNPTISGGVTPYTYSWSNSNTAAGTLSASNIANPVFTAATVTGTQTTNLTLTVTGATPSSCSTTATAIPVTVNRTPTPVLSTAGPNCENTNATINATPAGGTYAWTVTGTGSSIVSGGGAGNSSVTITDNIVSTSAGSQNVTVSLVQTINGCPSASVQTIVRFDNTPVAVTPTPIANQCGATSVNLTTTTPSYGSGVWSSSPSTTITNGTTASATAAVSAATPPSTTYQFTWTVSNGVCANATASVNFTNYSTVTGQPSTVSVCNQSPSDINTITANVNPSSLNGTWSSGSLTFQPPANTATVGVSGLATGANVATFTIDNGGFGSSSACYAVATVTINNTATATTNASTTNSPVCVSSPGTVTLNDPSNSVGTWSVTSQPSGASAGFTAPNSSPTNVTGLTVAGDYVFTWTVTNSCGTASNTVPVHVDAAASAVPVSQIVCASGPVNLEANSVTAPAVGTWTTAGGNPTIVDVNDPNSALSGVTPGNYTYTWTVVNGTCSASNDASVAILEPNDATLVTTNADYCSDVVNTVSLEANTVSLPHTGVWTIAAQPTGANVTLSNANLANASANNFTAGGDYVFTWTVTNGGVCQPDAASVIISITTAPVSDAGTDFSTCLTTTTLNANSTLNGTWTVTSGTGTFVNANSPTTSVSGLSTGVNIFTWTVSGGAVCSDAVSEVEVTNTVADMDVTVTGDGDTLCVGTSRSATVSVSSTTSSGNYVYYWSDQNGNALFNTTDPIVSFTPGAGVTTYYVVVMDANQVGCAADIDSVKIAAVGEQNLVIPNLMTPNGDELNDVLLIRDEQGKDLLPGSYLQVVNRWGEQVFESENYRNTWKAPNTSDGMYFYYLKAGCGGRIYKGWVHILGNNKP